MTGKQRAVFVDDEPKVLRGLRRALDDLAATWELVFVGSGPEALECMAKAPFDVVVSDMRMPGMSGVELLNEVRRLYPHTVRLALSGQASKEQVLSAIGPIHQYLPKPCDAETLKTTFARLWTLRDLLSVPKLQSVLAQLEHLPSLPSLYNRLIQECTSPEGSLREVGEIVTQDLGMSTKVLQLVNSAFFGLPRQVSGPAQAVAALGLDTVRSLAMAASVFSPFAERLGSSSIECLWHHSSTVASCAKRIAEVELKADALIDNAFIAGLLHDVGKLVLATTLPDDYAQAVASAEQQGVAQVETECAVIGAGHAQMGAYLLGLWGFATEVLQAVAYHHAPSTCPDQAQQLCAIVHAANAIAGDQTGTAPTTWSTLDHATISGLAFESSVDDWATMCGADVLEGVSS